MKFRAVRGITWAVPDLQSSARAFEAGLGYQVLYDGQVSKAQAALWQAPVAAGSPLKILGAASGAEVFVRLIQRPPVPGYQPLMSYGWNAAEFLVQDVHGLHERLIDSPFKIIGPPRDLLNNGAVIAMQVLGPGKELLYLTELRHPGLQKTYGRAASPVDRVYIVVLGVKDQEQTIGFYAPFAQRMNIRRQFRITRLAAAHGMDPQNSRFDIASVVFEQPFRIETDDYPDSAEDRFGFEGDLPPGLCLVSVSLCSARNRPALEKSREASPDPVKRSLTLGPDGERLELIQNGDPSAFL